MRGIFIFAAMVCILIGTGYGYVYVSAPSQDISSLENGKTQEIFEVTRGELVSKVACTGKITSNLDVEIKSKASGEVVAVHVDVSGKVTRGDLLVEIDPTEEERNLKQARTAMGASTARLEKSKAVLAREESSLVLERTRAERTLGERQTLLEDAAKRSERNISLYSKKLISEETRDAAVLVFERAKIALGEAQSGVDEVGVSETAIVTLEQDVILAEAQKANDEIAVEKAARRLDDTRVYAPINGVVSERQVQKGLIVSSPTSNVGGGTTMMIISDVTRLFASATVDECDIGVVAVGQTAEVTADAFPGRIFEGVVSRVAAKGNESSSVVTFEVLVEIRGEALTRLKPGMTANISISARTNGPVLLVPSKALVKRGGEIFLAVFGKSGGKSRRDGAGRPGNREQLSEIPETTDFSGEVVMLINETKRGAGERKRGAGEETGQTFRYMKVGIGRESDGMTEIVFGARVGMKAVIPSSAGESKWNKAGRTARGSENSEGAPNAAGAREGSRTGSGSDIMRVMRRIR